MGPKSKQNNKHANKKNKNDSYLADDKNYESFSAQLAKLGLELRDITGDGNCCFRALSDQINGDESMHLDIRRHVCEYMLRNRNEFEPFVAALIEDSEDDGKKSKKSSNKTLDAFEAYIRNLEKPGTYADNGVLVAFARLYNYDLNIHQLDLPIWTINSDNNTTKKPVRQLHLSYHNGEHYSSIRPKGDRTNNPTNITVNNMPANEPKNTKNKNHFKARNTDFTDYEDANNYYLDDSEDAINNLYVEQIIDSTNCHDVNLILDTLRNTNNDMTITIETILSRMQLDDRNESEDDENNLNGVLKKSTNSKQTKIDKKKEKKMRQMERQRLKILEQKEKEAHNIINKREIKPNQIVELNADSDSNVQQEFNILVNNIEKTSI